MKRRTFLQLAPALPASLAAQARRPNILLILADDLGWADLGAQGGREIPTPNIDSIARNGVRFTNAYVSCPVCSPTRAGLMTGRYQQRFGHEFNPGPAQSAQDNFGLPLTETTLAQRLKTLGYSTGLVGKWHLGYRPEYHPMRRGFDEFFGFLGGAHPYLGGRREDTILRGTGPAGETGYLTEAFAREAVSFLDRQSKDRPFFLYFAPNAVHAPMQTTEKYLGRFPGLEGNRRTHAGMLSALDDAVGRVLARVPDDTLIFFTSDNGGPTRVTTSRNDPLRGFKGQVWEGGIRVPFFVQWRGRVPAGKVSDQPVIALDVHPTAVAAAGGSIPKEAALDGVDLLPYAAGKAAGRPHAAMYWRFGPQRAIRKGDWKLVWEPGDPPHLFNLAQDVAESKDLASSEAAKVKELEADYDAWNRQLAEPRWQVQQMTKARKLNRKR